MADWYHENVYRAWPLQDPVPTLTYTPPVGGPSQVHLPSSTLVDFGAVLGPNIRTQATGGVRLDSIVRSGTTFTITVKTNFVGAEAMALVFVRNVNDGLGTTQYLQATTPGGGALGACGGALQWSGWLVTGPLADLAALVADGGRLDAGALAPPLFEPTTWRVTAGNFVSSVNLANQTRTHATAPGLPAPAPVYTYVVQATCLQGAMRFKAGYNANLRMDAFDNSLTIDAGVGAGLGQPCQEIKTFPGEQSPGGPFYSGGPDCASLILTINGQRGPVLKLTAGTGLTIEPDPNDTYGIIVSADMHDMTSCPSLAG